MAEAITALTRAMERGELALALMGPAPEGLSAEAWPDGHRRALAASPWRAISPSLPWCCGATSSPGAAGTSCRSR
ncbi:hypothetical protein [Cyanobium sp. ATX-6F1]|uniref:hypothetical protein n=1 Tax=Cyanobium sp. ATX-6F1 TaxID=3137388 RepID=UPI0039BE6EE3